MKNEFVPYDIALALKELGFDEPCMAYWVKSEFLGYPKPHLSLSNEFNQNNDTKDSFSGVKAFAPLYQQAFRWFRENSEFLEEKIGRMTKTTYSGSIWGGLNTIEVIENCTEQEAQDACLRKLIEIVKEK